MKEQLYEIEIKSQALIRLGQKGFITYFRGGTHEAIIKNCKALYPQFTNEVDNPVVNITPISNRTYKKRLKLDFIPQKQTLVSGKANIMKVEDYEDEVVGN